MKVFSVALSLVFAAGFTQTAAFLHCDSGCTACSKISSHDTADIKIPCDTDKECRTTCPDGYHHLHCVEKKYCSCSSKNCPQLGPCICGIQKNLDGSTSCRMAMPLNGGCE